DGTYEASKPTRICQGDKVATVPPGENAIGVAKKASSFASLLLVDGSHVGVCAAKTDAPRRNAEARSAELAARNDVTEGNRSRMRLAKVLATITGRFSLSPPRYGGRPRPWREKRYTRR